MPTAEIEKAIATLEAQLSSYEKHLDQAISNDEILAKTKAILHQLKKVAGELAELKKLKEIAK
jgi:hypothetical protein